MDLPAIGPIGGSPRYFASHCGSDNPYDGAVDWLAGPKPACEGFFYRDQLTQNIHNGRVEVRFDFHFDPFGVELIPFLYSGQTFRPTLPRVDLALRAHSHSGERR